MTAPALGPLVQSFFADGLRTSRGLRPTSVRSYRDVLRLFLRFVARDTGRKITRLALADFSFERVLQFVRYLEDERRNHIRTRNQRLACLHTFFASLADRMPELLEVAERVTAIPMKRVAPPETRFLERDEIDALFAALPTRGGRALRDRALLLLLYNTGARVQEVADLHVGDLELTATPRVRLHGKGDKWRTCPLWENTARLLRELLAEHGSRAPDAPVFASRHDRPLTRFGIYKLVRRHTRQIDKPGPRRRISPHVFRHTTAVHLLEAGVEINVIRSWLGHVSLDTTNRYTEITTPAKEAALRLCTAPIGASATLPPTPVWRTDESLLAWLNSL
jgi:site-specific recombinase XerD